MAAVAPGMFTPTPSIDRIGALTITAAPTVPSPTTILGLPVPTNGAVPPALGASRARLEEGGFRASIGETFTVATAEGPTLVAVGVGDRDALGTTGLREAAAAFALGAASRHGRLAFDLTGLDVPAASAAQAVVEGVMLARYTFEPLRAEPKLTPVIEITFVVSDEAGADALAGAERGRAFAGATALARDLANTPHSHLNATGMADIARELGEAKGLTVEVFDKGELESMGCGGILGVNAGSAEPPRMVRLRYRPEGSPTGHLTLVGKGIMYDSGGIALKPGDEMHATMKNDMSGAAAILASMLALAELGCPSAVTGYLMCTDNMPSGTAMALGDVITMRGGTTVEVLNTDAEGRLIMADALVLATEEPTDAIVDIATLTGACLRALGTEIAGVMGNDAAVIERIRAAGDATDEPVWELPLARRYRKELDSPVADIRNMGGPNAGAITAALFLEEFVGGRPWAHIDIAGTAQVAAGRLWHTAGCSGFGSRLLLQLALDFEAAP